MLYDGTCGFCRIWVARLARWDRLGAIELVPLQSRTQVPDLPDIAAEELLRAIHLVLPDGRYYSGGYAVPVLLRWLPWGWVLRPFFLIPGFTWITDRVYHWVAVRRHRFGCGGDACEYIPPTASRDN